MRFLYTYALLLAGKTLSWGTPLCRKGQRAEHDQLSPPDSSQAPLNHPETLVRSSMDIWTCSHPSSVLGIGGQLGQHLCPSQLLSQDSGLSGHDLPDPCGQLGLASSPVVWREPRLQLFKWAVLLALMRSHRARVTILGLRTVPWEQMLSHGVGKGGRSGDLAMPSWPFPPNRRQLPLTRCPSPSFPRH